jgi:protein-S-isoprenylcysteine O-methyltransferase Ste14
MIGTLISLFVILCVFALLYWGMTQLPLPPVIRTVVIVIMGLIALLFIWNMFAGGGGFHLSVR